MKTKLIFGIGNAKLAKNIATFSLPCGWTCPFAKACKTKVGRDGGLVEKGHEIRCYAATQELLFRNTRNSRWGNFEALKKARTVKAMADLIHRSLPNKPIIRLHASGDFFNQTYFDAWVKVAERNPSKLFYAYTKAIPYLLARPTLPVNFKLVASYGGTHDDLIAKHKLQSARVVFSEDEAKVQGLKVSHDDADAYRGLESFAILIHGQQPADSPAAAAWYALMKAGKAGYKTSYSMDKYSRFGKYKQRTKETYARNDA